MRSYLLSLLAATLLTTNTSATPRAIAPPPPEPMPVSSMAFSVASDGERFLSIWRQTYLPSPVTNESVSLMAWLTTADGQPVIPAPVVLEPDTASNAFAGSAAAAWNGEDYLIVWSVVSPDPARRGIRGVRMSRDGELLSEPWLLHPGSQGRVALGWNGREYLLTVEEGDASRPQALLLDSATNLISRARLDRPVGLIVPFGNTFLIGDLGFRSYVAIIDAELKARLLAVESAPIFDMAAGSSEAIAVSSFDSDSLEIQRFDATQADPPIRFFTAAPVRSVRIVRTAGGYVAVFTVRLPNGLSEVYALEISSAGVPVGAARKIAGPGAFDLIDAVVTASDIVVQYRGGGDVLRALAISSTADFPLSLRRPDQVEPKLAASLDGYFVVWLENSPSERRLVGSRVGADGATTGERLVLAKGNFLGYAVSFDGTNFLAAWTTSGEIHLQRIAPDGSIKDADTLLIAAPDAFEVSLSWNGFETLLAWSTPAPGQDFRHIKGALIRGRVASPLGTISRALEMEGGPFKGADYEPHLAWTGSHWVLTWQSLLAPRSCPSPCIGKTAEGAVRIAATGAVIDSAGIPVPGLKIASNGTDSLIVWDTGRGVPATISELRGSRLSADGVLLDGMGGFLIANNGREPAVIALGNSYEVAGIRTDPHTDSTGLLMASVDGTFARGPVRATLPEKGMLVESTALALGSGSKLFIATSEQHSQPPYSGSSLITGRFASELAVSGPAPEPPSNVRAFQAGSDFVVTWRDVSNSEAAYVVEIGGSATSTWVSTWVPADTELARLRVSAFDAPAGGWARVWAYNSGGPSEVVTVPVLAARERPSAK